ncbi:uncharacterized protein V6R79_016181 [Siganus canaliculatus]
MQQQQTLHHCIGSEEGQEAVEEATEEAVEGAAEQLLFPARPEHGPPGASRPQPAGTERDSSHCTRKSSFQIVQVHQKNPRHQHVTSVCCWASENQEKIKSNDQISFYL